MTWFLVVVAGAVGTAARYGIGLAVGPRPFPYATLGINVVGSFLIAFVLVVGAEGRMSAQTTTASAVFVIAPLQSEDRGSGRVVFTAYLWPQTLRALTSRTAASSGIRTLPGTRPSIVGRDTARDRLPAVLMSTAYSSTREQPAGTARQPEAGPQAGG